MSFKLTYKKPTFDLDSIPLCDFRTSKAYLWGLIRHELLLLQNRSLDPLYCLDAACHALITRNMFPPSAQYFGLDISRSRLSSARRISRDSDTIYLADLALDLPLSNCFDVVVSCNTLSHINIVVQPKVVTNLINYCRPNGSLFINTCVGPGMSDVANILNKYFDNVQPIYFESTSSVISESANRVTRANVHELLKCNEFDVPNDAAFHRQVLFLARGKYGQGESICNPPTSSGGKIITLSKIPNVNHVLFEDDLTLIEDLNFWSDVTDVLITSRFLESPLSLNIVSKLNSLSIHFQALDSSIDITSLGSRIVILGLELSWTSSQAVDRLAINRLRTVEGISITFATVSTRGGKKCSPSLVVGDV